MRFPQFEQVENVPSTNFGGTALPKICIVGHVIVGSGDSAVAEFLTPGAELSAHFVVSGPGESLPDGFIRQLLDTDDACYAQAAGNYPPEAGIAIEVAGYPTAQMTVAQVDAVVRIIQVVAPHHGIPIVGLVEHGQAGITTHCHPDGQADPAWGDHPCPGPLRIPQFALAVQLATSSPPPPPPPPSGGLTSIGGLFMPTAELTNGFIVRQLYLQCLGRAPDPGGYETDVNALNNGTTVEQIMINLQESAEGQGFLAAQRKALGLG